MRRRFTLNKQEFNPDKYLTIEALEDGLQISHTNIFEYKTDNSGWQHVDSNELTPNINKGECLYIRANWARSKGLAFTITRSCNLRGNCLSLLFGNNADNQRDISKYSYAFSSLFAGCNIKEVSSKFLPATTLAEWCYYGMFKGCTGLTQAPDLPATTLTDRCYNNMFSGCTNLNYIKMLATDISAAYCLHNWVSGVASTGTFVKSKDATWDVVGDSGVPTGWTVITDDQEGDSGLGLEFPLYLEFDNCEETFNEIACTREADEIGVKLYELLTDVCVKYGEDDNGTLIISEQILDMLGIGIYLDNLKVTICYLFPINNQEKYINLEVSADIWADLFSYGLMNKTAIK